MLTTIALQGSELPDADAPLFGYTGERPFVRFLVDPADYDIDRRQQVVWSLAAITFWTRVHLQQGVQPDVPYVDRPLDVARDVRQTLEAFFLRSTLVATLGKTVRAGSLVQLEGADALDFALIGTAASVVNPEGKAVLSAALQSYDEQQARRWDDSPREVPPEFPLSGVIVDPDSLSISGSRLALV